MQKEAQQEAEKARKAAERAREKAEREDKKTEKARKQAKKQEADEARNRAYLQARENPESIPTRRSARLNGLSTNHMDLLAHVEAMRQRASFP